MLFEFDTFCEAHYEFLAAFRSGRNPSELRRWPGGWKFWADGPLSPRSIDVYHGRKAIVC